MKDDGWDHLLKSCWQLGDPSSFFSPILIGNILHISINSNKYEQANKQSYSDIYIVELKMNQILVINILKNLCIRLLLINQIEYLMVEFGYNLNLRFNVNNTTT